MPSADDYPSPPASPAKVDPVLRNALRYTISAKEYETLHQYLIARSPPSVRKRVPQPPRYEAIVQSKNDYNAAAVRASLRVFLATQTGLKIWDLVTTHVLARGRPQKPKPNTSIFRSPNLRLSLSLSLILLLHRILHRFFTRLRYNLLTKTAARFRERNPRISRTLTSQFAPAVGASFAGFALGVYPSDQFRITIAIYAATRAAEFAYNALEDEGWFKGKPWWWGSWMLMPIATGQLLHAFVFDRECFPKAYGDFILKHTPNYVQRRPADYPSHLPWPSTTDIVDSLAQISQLNWPPFISPILFPTITTLPPSLTTIAPITSPAHPSIRSLSCALLHPTDPSCTRTFLTFWLTAFPALTKFFSLLLTLFSLPRYRLFLSSPLKSTSALAARILRLSTFMTAAIGTSWASICLFTHLLPRNFLPTKRWYLGGFLGGLWAFLERSSGRANFLYSARLSVDSLWKVGVKRGWWKGVRDGDVWIFVAALMVVNVVYEADPKAVSGGVVRKGLGFLRGEGWVDRAVIEKDNENENENENEHEGETVVDEDKLQERERKATGFEPVEGVEKAKQEDQHPEAKAI
ncbi:MAG: hypothetical protein M1830_005567 [Pleopsidium flavum]|nr:MAG: hypothetical protein M1830_005567 [Pleopsidium flavum]